MTNSKTAATSILLAAVLALGACSSTPMGSSRATGPGTVLMTTQLSGASEVPPVSTIASGSAEVSYNQDTNMLRWTVTYAGLSGLATGGHLHGPAMPGENAPVAIPFNGSLASPISGGLIISPSQANELLSGKWYVNIHTQANPGGEIRGQVVRVN